MRRMHQARESTRASQQACIRATEIALADLGARAARVYWCSARVAPLGKYHEETTLYFSCGATNALAPTYPHSLRA